MPRQITQYRVFIGSPSGLKPEREAFRRGLETCSRCHGASKNVQFEPVGWEDTVGGAGRPQALINADLEECDYAVFVLHDRWGTPTGSGHTSGTEEEWALAEKLYEANKIRNIALFFKTVDAGKLADPGEHLKPVLAFRKRIEEGKRYLFRAFDTIDEFREGLEGHLARWLTDHDKRGSGLSATTLGGGQAPSLPSLKLEPSHAFWIAEGRAAEDNPDVRLYFAEKALGLAKTDVEWADALNMWGFAKADLGVADEAIAAFSQIANRLASIDGSEEYHRIARALVNKGATLNDLGRNEEAITIYDEVISRFAMKSEGPVRESVAAALFNKGVSLAAVGRGEEAIAVYDDHVAHYATAAEGPLREHVADALINKGFTLGTLGRDTEAISVYDDVVARFAAASECPVREQVANALVNKGVALERLGRSEEAVSVYDDVVARFSSASELSLRERAAIALVNKGVTLETLGKKTEAIAAYDDLATRFASASEGRLREQVANALINKGCTLGTLNRNEEAISAFDDVLARFGTAAEGRLRERVASAMINKSARLGLLGRNGEAIAFLDEVITRFADEPLAADAVQRAKDIKRLVTPFIWQ